MMKGGKGKRRGITLKEVDGEKKDEEGEGRRRRREGEEGKTIPICLCISRKIPSHSSSTQ